MLFSAGTFALVTVGGIWLKYVVDQQLKAKDTTIQHLGAALTAKEAEISGLKGERAPAIVRDLREMIEHANRMAEERRKLSEQVERLTEEQKENSLYLPIHVLLKRIETLSFASELLKQAFAKHTADSFVAAPPAKNWTESLILSLVGVQGTLDLEMHSTSEAAKAQLIELRTGRK